MNLTQNDRIKLVTSDTLIVGVDVELQTHLSLCSEQFFYEQEKQMKNASEGISSDQKLRK